MEVTELHLPTRLDPGFSPTRTADIGRVIEQWGRIPLKFLEGFAEDRYMYGYVGTEDYTMYPILPPGSFLQIDPMKSRIRKGSWRSEYDRPVYFLETREEYLCGWCALRDGKIILQPHSLSGCEPRIFKADQEAEVIGQVVGAAIRVGDDRSARGEAVHGESKA